MGSCHVLFRHLEALVGIIVNSNQSRVNTCKICLLDILREYNVGKTLRGRNFVIENVFEDAMENHLKLMAKAFKPASMLIPE